MATICERTNKRGQLIGYQAKVRRRGQAPVSKTFTKKSDAERWARQIETEMEQGVFVSRVEAESNTLGDLVDRYLVEVTPTHKGAKQEGQRLRLMRRDDLCHRIVATLKGIDFAKWRDTRQGEVSPGTVIRELNLWHAVIETARREWGVHLPSNPVSLVRRPRANAARDRRLVGDEEARLFAACDADTLPWLGPITRLAVHTGMRQGELLSLTWDDICLDPQRPSAFLRETKNGDARVVPLSSAARDVLERLPQSISGHLFPIDQNVLKMRFRRACTRAKIDGLTFHDLRHEATSRFFERGLGLMEVASITGHKTLQMLKRYTHLQACDLARKLG